jgi:hypothetical protein
MNGSLKDHANPHKTSGVLQGGREFQIPALTLFHHSFEQFPVFPLAPGIGL